MAENASDDLQSITKWLWENREWVMKKLGEVFSWFKDNEQQPGILIIGPGGAGKTTLGSILAGQVNFLLQAVGQYEESIRLERFTMHESPEIEIVVPPGQKHRREHSWRDLQAGIAAGDFRGIILVGAYGYHSLGPISYEKHKLYTGNKNQFIENYLSDRRNEEIEVLRQLTPYLKTSRRKLWLFSLITKQDLWWKERANVEEHYRDGKYGTEIRNILSETDLRLMRHEMAFVSLLICNFTTGAGQLLRPNTEGYDHSLQVKSWRQMFESLSALREWELGQ